MLADTLRRVSTARKIRGVAVGPTVVRTATNLIGTARATQQHLDRTKNGVLWSALVTASGIELSRSTDRGATFQLDAASTIPWDGTGSTLWTPTCAIFIDADDFMHVAYKDYSNAYIYYRRGTPNADRTSWAWSSAALISSNQYDNYPDIVAHREGSGWKAHVVFAYQYSESGSYTTYTTEYEWQHMYHHGSYPTADGAPDENTFYHKLWSTSSTVAPSFPSTLTNYHVHTTLGGHSHTYTKTATSSTKTGSTRQVNPVTQYYTNYYNYTRYRQISISSTGVVTQGNTADIGGNYGQNWWSFPSIDFRHTGDGKTAHSAPDIFVAWTSGYDIRYKRGAYASGVWTWGTEKTIDSNRHLQSDLYWLQCLFDGTVVLIGGFFSGTVGEAVWERNVGDTSQTLRHSSTLHRRYGSMTYDSERNIYIAGTTATPQLFVTKFDRKLSTVTSWMSAVAKSNIWISFKRGWAGDRIDYVYVDGAASPYQVTYGGYR